MLVTRNFPPLLGGMERLNQHLLASLQPEWSTAICGPQGCGEYVPAETEVKQSELKPLARFLMATLHRAMRLAWARKPEWVIAGSGLTAPIAWLAARSVRRRVAVYLHGLDIVASSRIYQWFWLPFIRHCDLVLVNSTNTGRLATANGVPPNRIHVLHPGTELPLLDERMAEDFRRRFNLGKRPLLLTVGRLTQRKGLAAFVTKALPSIVSRHPDTLLLIIGDEAGEALQSRSGSERERILAAAHASGVEKHVFFLGRCDEATLTAAYQASNVHIFPVLELPGDVEGFGMVALEAAAHGLRTVAFAVGGVPDAVEDGVTGRLIAPNNYDDFVAAVISEFELVHDATVINGCIQFAASKAWPIFGKRLRDLLSASYV